MTATLYAAAAAALVFAAVAGSVWRAGRRWRRTCRALAIVVFAGLVLPSAVLSGYLCWRRAAGTVPNPFTTPVELRPGIVFRHEVLTTPGPAVVHVLEIADPAGCRFVVSPPVDTPSGPRCVAMTATDAAAAFDTAAPSAADFVINANFFRPFRDQWFLDYAPHAGDLVEPVGTVVAGGRAFGFPKPGWPSFWQRPDGTVGLGELPADARSAVTGRQWLLRDGVVAVTQDEPPYPRTAIAADADRRRLWLVVVDGKQPGYSDGLTLRGLADYLAKLGATDAIELDGGGSSTMTYAWHNGPVVLNSPCHTKIPGRQRPCGVFLGVSRG